MTNYYKILGVADFSSQEEIKKAFRKLSKKFHPDVNDGDEFFANKFRELKEAYDFLTDDSKRASLDSFLRGGSSHQSTQNNTYKEDKNRQKAQEEFRRKQKAEEEELLRKAEEYRKSRKKNKYDFDKKEYEKELNNKIGKPSNNKKKSSWLPAGFIGAMVAFGIYKCNDFNNRSNYPPIVDNNYVDSVSSAVVDYSSGVVDSSYTGGNDYNYQNTAQSSYDTQDLVTNQEFYTLGSSKEEVKRIQGSPTRISNYETIGEIWGYGSSTITFKNGRVYEYSDNQDQLFIEILPETDYLGISRFSIGATKFEVKKAQGTPTRINKYESIGEIWSYDGSTVTFKNDKVAEYNDFRNILNVE